MALQDENHQLRELVKSWSALLEDAAGNRQGSSADLDDLRRQIDETTANVNTLQKETERTRKEMPAKVLNATRSGQPAEQPRA